MSLLVHNRIRHKGEMEQFFGLTFSDKSHTKKITRQTKGRSKHNAKRRDTHPSGLHPDRSKEKQRYY